MDQPVSSPITTDNAHEPAATTAPRRVYNPIQKDSITFLKTAEETNGGYSLMEMEVAPGGGNPLHYHKAFAEHFTVVSGEFGVKVGKDEFVLKPGQGAVAPAMILHRWSNTSQHPATVRIELRPGHTGFERGLQIFYGLARDGLTTKKGPPKNIVHTALLVELTDTNAPGLFSMIAPLFRLLAKRARRTGVERELVSRYCL